MTEATETAEDTYLKRMVMLIVSAALLTMCVAVLLQLYFSFHWAGTLAASALVVFLITGQRWFKLRERFLISMAILITMVAFVAETNAVALVHSALVRAAFLAAFMLLLSLLKDAASTSQAVLGVGTYLTKQPPGRRYIAIHAGGHALGVVLNFGVLSLLGPLIQRGVKASDGDNAIVSQVRERRQLSALARGFSAVIAWSPTSVAQAMIPVMIIGADPLRVSLMGASVALVMLGFGWAEDRLRYRSLRAQLDAQGIRVTAEHPVFPARDFCWFIGICVLLACLAVYFMFGFGVRIVPGLMLAAPLVTCFWIWVQNRQEKGGLDITLERYKSMITQTLPSVSPEAVTLAVAGYIGLVAGGLIPAESFAKALGLATVSPVVVYIVVAAIIPIASNFALPPMMTATFLAAMLTHDILPGLNMSMLGFAIAMGWLLNLTGSPFGATILLLSRVTGISGTVLSWRWNGTFTLMTFVVVALAIVIFSGF